MSGTDKRKHGKNASSFDLKYILSDDTPFSVKEAYKALRTNVIFSLPGQGAKVIGITSSSRGEMKSTVAVNLAISFGQIGKRVLLIDGDLRLPTVAPKLGIKGSPGLSDILVGETAQIRHLSDFGIYVLPAGTTPPDATTLLSSSSMEILLDNARKSFDYIFIDLPPVTVVADASILAKHIDGFLLNIRHNRSRYRSISEMLEQLSMANANILGYVYTGDLTTRKYYKKRYGYSYGYGYGSSREEK